MNGRDGTTAFLPLDSKIGGHVGLVKPNIGQFLTREQTNYIYKKVETGEIINTDTIQDRYHITRDGTGRAIKQNR